MKAKEKTKKPIHIFICGGEPTLYKKLVDVVNGVADVFQLNDILTIQTNMSKSLSWFNKFLNELISTEYLKINGSYHNTQGCRLSDLICKSVFLKEKDVLGMISFGYNKLKNVKSDFIKARNIIGSDHCEIVPLINSRVDQLGNNNGSGNDIDYIYANENMNEFKEYGHFFQELLQCEALDGEVKTERRADMWLRRDNNFLGSRCSVSKHKLYVDWDGNCYNCFNKQYTNLQPSATIHDNESIDRYFSKLTCLDCQFTTCFFDLEYMKVYNNKPVEEVKLSRHYNTNEYRRINNS
jgi:organic radical activating enzyme